MELQTKYIVAGVTGAAITKFYCHRSWVTAIVVGLSVISAYAIVVKPSVPAA